MDRSAHTEDRWSAASDQSCPENLTSCAGSANLRWTPADGNGSTMHNPQANKRRIGATLVFGLTATLALLLACAVRVEAAVTLYGIEVTAQNGYILIKWRTANELDNAGFKLYRAEADDFGQATELDDIDSQCPGCREGFSYSYLDDGDIDPGVTYHYWLESFNLGLGSELYYLGSATVGASATATPTSTPTSLPTATPTSTPTATPTSTPTAVASATTTSTPTSLPSGTPTSTPATRPTATPTSVATGTPSPALTTIATSETRAASATAAAEATPSGTATTHAVAAPTEPGATPSPPARTGWPAISMPTILIFVSVASFLGVLLLSMVLVLVRKFGL